MASETIYEIAYFDGAGDDALVIERTQLLSVDGVLRLSNADGSETRCEGEDPAAVISSTPSLREIRAGSEVRISCDPEIAAELPFVLVPVLDGADPDECYVKVNSGGWTAFPTLDGEHVMLPGWDQSDGPDLSPCWATLSVEEGEWNPLIGFTSIGVVAPGVAVEFGRCSPGGLGTESAVVLSRFDDFAAVFVDWLLHWEMLNSVWYGDVSPIAPTRQLFAEAAAAANKRAGWNAEDDKEDNEDDDDDEDEDSSHWAEAYLELFLSDELIEQVRARLESLK
jgi:hypothetical protein